MRNGTIGQKINFFFRKIQRGFNMHAQLYYCFYQRVYVF